MKSIAELVKRVIRAVRQALKKYAKPAMKGLAQIALLPFAILARLAGAGKQQQPQQPQPQQQPQEVPDGMDGPEGMEEPEMEEPGMSQSLTQDLQEWKDAQEAGVNSSGQNNTQIKKLTEDDLVEKLKNLDLSQKGIAADQGPSSPTAQQMKTFNSAFGGGAGVSATNQVSAPQATARQQKLYNSTFTGARL